VPPPRELPDLQPELAGDQPINRGADEAYVKAVGTLRAFVGRLAPERAERLLAADPVKEILSFA
jgi:hypothetical protein